MEPKFKQDRFQYYVDQQDWSEDDKTTVMKLLESALQLNYLIRASEVDYDVENGVIKNIKKLKIEENEGGKSFTIIQAKNQTIKSLSLQYSTLFSVIFLNNKRQFVLV